MANQLFLISAPEDRSFAAWLVPHLTASGYDVSSAGVLKDTEHAIRTSLAIIVLVSPDSATSEQVTQQCALGRHFHRKLIPVLIRHVDALPWYLKDLQFEDFTVDAATALSQLMTSLPAPETHLTLGFARDAYLQRATLKSEHTISSYRRAIELFIEFIGERPLRRITSILPIQQQTFVTPEEIPLSALTEDDAPLFLHFAQWLLSPASGKSGDKRPYKPSTVELRLAGVQNWFQFLDDYGWLPGSFKLAKATRIVRDELRGRPQRSGPPQPPDHIEEVIYFYDNLELPARLRKPNVDPQRIQRWELTQQRNRALLRALAETGGRISEILSLNLDDFPPRNLAQQEVLRVEVVGKGGHPYYLRFFDTLPAIHAYIQARGTNLRATARGDVPLFVSHDPRYDGNRMGRVVAWRVAQRAARALGLRGITPHDFRHWRATQLINAGHSLDVVQEYLGHRSVETTRAYYAHTDPLRVDDAARNTPLPERDNDAD